MENNLVEALKDAFKRAWYGEDELRFRVMCEQFPKDQEVYIREDHLFFERRGEEGLVDWEWYSFPTTKVTSGQKGKVYAVVQDAFNCRNHNFVFVEFEDDTGSVVVLYFKPEALSLEPLPQPVDKPVPVAA